MVSGRSAHTLPGMSCPDYRDEDYSADEPDYEAIAEARAEARAQDDLERAEREYERYVYGD